MEIQKDKKNKIAWNNFSKITNITDLSEYLKREYEHTEYNHYTDLEAINNILESREFFLSDVRGFNDKKDTEQFKDRLYFSLCFSTGINENLSLWYLYSGIDGKGGCISFKRNRIRQLIENAKYELWKFKGLPNKSNAEKLCDIKIGKNANIVFADMLYYSEEIPNKKRKEENMALKYNTMTNYQISKDEFQKFKERNRGKLKNLIWYYEKETRLLIELTDEKLKKEVNECNEKYYASKNVNGENSKANYKIVMNFNHLNLNDFQVKLAPGNIDYSEISDYENITKYCNDTSNINLSLYKGEIDFKLKDKMCKNCEENKKRSEENQK